MINGGNLSMPNQKSPKLSAGAPSSLAIRAAASLPMPSISTDDGASMGAHTCAMAASGTALDGSVVMAFGTHVGGINGGGSMGAHI